MRDTLIDGLDVLYHHAKFGNIVLQATAVGPVGAKIWCLYVCFYPRDVVRAVLSTATWLAGLMSHAGSLLYQYR